VYRYRLALNAHNDGVNSRVIEGFRLRKDTWLMSDDVIDFRSFKDLIEEQSASSVEDFNQLDLEEVCLPVEEMRPIVETPVEKIEPKKKDDTSSVEKKLLARGFSSSELRGRTGADLEDLLLFDTTITPKRGY
jgi:hypothetical protein